MTLTLHLNPAEEARLSTAARDNGLDPDRFARKLLIEHLPAAPCDARGIDPENAAAIALLRAWLQEEATDDPEVIASAQKDLDEFKQNLNANRLAGGERPLFPV